MLLGAIIDERVLEIGIIEEIKGHKALDIGKSITFFHDIPAKSGKIRILNFRLC